MLLIWRTAWAPWVWYEQCPGCLRVAGSHWHQLQCFTLPPVVSSQHHYSPLLVVTSSKVTLQTLRIWLSFSAGGEWGAAGSRTAARTLLLPPSSTASLVVCKWVLLIGASLAFPPEISSSYCRADTDILCLLQCLPWGTDNHIPIGQCAVAWCFAWPNDAIFLPKYLSDPASSHPFVLDKAYSK